MIVAATNNSYGIPEDLFFSFPILIKEQKWRIVKGLKLSSYLKKNNEIAVRELKEEKIKAF